MQLENRNSRFVLKHVRTQEDSGPKINNKSGTRVSNIEWISIFEDTGQQNHDINKGIKQL